MLLERRAQMLEAAKTAAAAEAASREQRNAINAVKKAKRERRAAAEAAKEKAEQEQRQRAFERQKMEEAAKATRCIARLHRKIVQIEPRLPFALKQEFHDKLSAEIRKAKKESSGADELLETVALMMAPAPNVLTAPTSFSTHYWYRTKDYIANTTIDTIPAAVSSKAIQKFRILPKTVEAIMEAKGFWLENDAAARAKAIVGDTWAKALKLLNVFIAKIKEAYEVKFGNIQEADIVPIQYKMKFDMSTLMHYKRNLDSQGVHASMAKLYCKRLNNHYPSKSPFFTSVDAIKLIYEEDKEFDYIVRDLTIPKSFASAVRSGTAFALCIIHNIDKLKTKSMMSTLVENVKGGHTSLAIIDRYTLYVCDAFYFSNMGLIPDTILNECNVANPEMYTTHLLGSDTQMVMELMDDDLQLFHKIAMSMSQELAIPIAFTYVGHKFNRDFYGHCGTIALFVAEFIIRCHRAENIKGFGIPQQVQLILQAYNPCFIYNYLRLWVRCMEQDVDLSNSKLILSGGTGEMNAAEVIPGELVAGYSKLMQELKAEIESQQ